MVTKRADRFVTTGCLTTVIALIAVLGLVVSWLWYRHWYDGDVNSERREQALASILESAHTTADDTVRALATSGTNDADALTGVIWQLSQAPVITYDASRREFTAPAEVSAQYEEKSMLPGGGYVRATRCFIFTFTQRLGQAWTSKVSERDDDVCRPSTQIGSRVRLALTRVSGMYAEDLTRAGVQKVLDPTGLRFFDVKNVVREGDTMTISVLVLSSDAEVDQCYHFIRPVQDGNNQGSATPASSC